MVFYLGLIIVYWYIAVLAVTLAVGAYPLGQIVGAVSERRWPRCSSVVLDLCAFVTAWLCGYLGFQVFRGGPVLTCLSATIFGALMGALNRDWPVARQIAERYAVSTESAAAGSFKAILFRPERSQQRHTVFIACGSILSLAMTWYRGQSIFIWPQEILLVAVSVSIATVLSKVPMARGAILRTISGPFVSPYAIQTMFIAFCISIFYKTSLVQTLATGVMAAVMWPMSFLPSTLGSALIILPYLSVLYLILCAGICLCTLSAVQEFSPSSATLDRALAEMKRSIPVILSVLAMGPITGLVLGMGGLFAAGFLSALAIALMVRSKVILASERHPELGRKDTVAQALPLEYVSFVLIVLVSLQLPFAFPILSLIHWFFPLLAAYLFAQSRSSFPGSPMHVPNAITHV